MVEQEPDTIREVGKPTKKPTRKPSK